MPDNYKVRYRLDYEPFDIETLMQMMKYKSKHLPTVELDDFEEGLEIGVKVGSVPTAVDKQKSNIYLKVENKVYRFTLFHAEPVSKLRYGYRMLNIVQINEEQYLDLYNKVGIDFSIGKASERLYFKLAGQNINIAVEYGLV